MGEPRPIPVTETAREERARCRALAEAGYMPAAEYVAKYSKPRTPDEDAA
jgi:hypothetical protein